MEGTRTDETTTAEIEQELQDKWVGKRVRVKDHAGSRYAGELGTVQRLDYMDVCVIHVEMDDVLNLDGVSPTMVEKVEEDSR